MDRDPILHEWVAIGQDSRIRNLLAYTTQHIISIPLYLPPPPFPNIKTLIFEVIVSSRTLVSPRYACICFDNAKGRSFILVSSFRCGVFTLCLVVEKFRGKE